ncbi:MAG: hypothetical protein ACI8W8_004333, partial [Rhodothermales bacterium]
LPPVRRNSISIPFIAYPAPGAVFGFATGSIYLKR